MNDICIVHEPTKNEPFLIIDKPSGLPSAPLKENDDCALSQAIKLFPILNKVNENANNSGRKQIERGLIHRLDTETSGLILIASTQEFYDFIIQVQKEGKFEKWYKAKVDNIPNIFELLEGFPCNSTFELESKKIIAESYFRPYGLHNSQVRPVTEASGKAALKKCGRVLYKTNIEISSDKTSAICSITSGYRHQVRCHLSWCGFPVVGDKLYNPNYLENENCKLEFRACKISFPNFEFEIE